MTNIAWTVEMMQEVGTRHATLEANGELEATMETLVANPVYEFWPMGKQMTGRAAVRRYYEHLIDTFMPSQVGYTMIQETVGPHALSQEYVIELQGSPISEFYRVLGVLYAAPDSPGLLGGERIWGSDAFLRKMIGPIWDELETIKASR